VASAKKYQVGKISRKDLMNAIEHVLGVGGLMPGESVVRINTCRGKKYEIRAQRLPHGIRLDWGLPGTFFTPRGYDNG
jgi:hypothetical protein